MISYLDYSLAFVLILSLIANFMQKKELDRLYKKIHKDLEKTDPLKKN